MAQFSNCEGKEGTGYHFDNPDRDGVQAPSFYCSNEGLPDLPFDNLYENGETKSTLTIARHATPHKSP